MVDGLHLPLLSAVSLLLLYPLMYKVYHQETDDMLSNNTSSTLSLKPSGN